MCSMSYVTSHVSTAVLCQLVVLSWVSVLCSRLVFWHFSRTYCLHLLGDRFRFTWMLQQLGGMFQLHVKATGNMANQSCEKCSVLLALSFPHSYNFPVFFPHFSVYRKWRQYIPSEHWNTHPQHSAETPKKTNWHSWPLLLLCCFCCCHCPSERMFVAEAATV